MLVFSEICMLHGTL